MENVTNYYVSNIPEGCRPWDLASALKDFGKLTSSYIPRRRNNMGCRFGFISFKDVKDRKELEKSLQGFKLGGCKLEVNIANFSHDNSGIPELEVKDKRQEAQIDPPFQEMAHGGNQFLGGRSFRDTLVGSRSKVEETKTVVVPDHTRAFSSLFGKALVGRVVDFYTLRSLNAVASKAGVGNMKIQYLGGFNVFLSFKEDERLEAFLNEPEILGNWFSSLDKWVGQSLHFERLARVKFIGMPLHLAENAVFDSVGSLFGKVVQPAQVMESYGDLSTIYVGILMGEGNKINEALTLRWLDKTYRVWV